MTDQLPIPDYDNLPENALANRIRTLDADGVAQLLEYERGHANRIQVVMVLERRLGDLRSGDAAPTGGDPAGAQPEVPGTPDRGSPVEATDQQQYNQPLRHGVAGQTPNRPIR
ncbi:MULTISPECIES: hypothetical protein [unclassified Pseudonocardia]|uniref:hypothetical protein n=1 Tax=unclassified Pseudonocardia TaxID=2619320 RepID=UPI00094B76AB|nr:MULTISPECIES: hypothetical protein [unclassified Pseudonocardia]OLL76986.1 hypothetical protein Ae150APs1_5364c [Pseudonocardia sp. Ae150A_Ps1]OLL88902.1 hypothetical protein Ae263Ps1_5957 [Pseudonocardia sp. Ae263_Ps1]OLL91073.1 hypothetical protein Ae356Ps1_0970c [Pseudonocardia sp. Ae356_Ps1]